VASDTSAPDILGPIKLAGLRQLGVSVLGCPAILLLLILILIFFSIFIRQCRWK